LQQRDTDGAALHFYDGLRLSADAGVAIGRASNLDGIALCVLPAERVRAGRAFARASRGGIRARRRAPIMYRAFVEREVTALRESLGQDAFGAALQPGVD